MYGIVALRLFSFLQHVDNTFLHTLVAVVNPRFGMLQYLHCQLPIVIITCLPNRSLMTNESACPLRCRQAHGDQIVTTVRRDDDNDDDDDDDDDKYLVASLHNPPHHPHSSLWVYGVSISHDDDEEDPLINHRINGPRLCPYPPPRLADVISHDILFHNRAILT